jgi:DNA-binding NarL/FixJ family response regulator
MNPIPDIAELLPGILADIAEQVSAGAALRLARDFGGSRCYIPATVTKDSRLARALGFDDAVKVAALLGAGEIEVPLGDTGSAAQRRRRLGELIAQGENTPTIVRALRIHRSTVKRHKARLRDGQGDLFGDSD